MKPLETIETFGEIDAESDDLLSRCFEMHPGFEEALNGRRFLIVGRKGTGKTAIFKRLIALSQSTPTYFTVGHSFADYPWHYHDLQVIPAAADQERYLHSWQYLILLSLSKILLKQDQSQPWSEEACEPILPAKTLRHLKSLNIDLKLLKLQGEADELAMSQLPKVFQDVNRALQACVMAALNPAHRYYICFDQVDIGFEPSSDQYKNRSSA